MRTLYSLVILASLAPCAAAALSPAQLDPDEQAIYQTLKGNATAASKFLVTREYVRQAQAVVSGRARAANFTGKPDGFEEQYLLPGHNEEDAIKRAGVLNIAAMAGALWG